MYICSMEEVVTDKGCGHRLPPWLVFSWTPFCPLAPTRHPSSRPARSLQHPTSACSAAQLPCPMPACAAPARFRGLGPHGRPSPVTVTTRSALACCLRKRWTPSMPGSCSGPSKPATTRAEAQGAASSSPCLFWVLSGQSPRQPLSRALPACV